MQILGFKTYHLYECIVVHGLPHMEVFEEAVIAQCNDLSGIKKFTKADYERWLGDYDVSLTLLAIVSSCRSMLYALVPCRGNEPRWHRYNRGLCRRSRCEIHPHRARLGKMGSLGEQYGRGPARHAVYISIRDSQVLRCHIVSVPGYE